MRPACIGSAILAAVLAWPAMPPGCLAALAASPRSGVAPAPPARPAAVPPASSTAAPAAEGQGSGGAPAAAGASPPAAAALWFAAGVARGGGTAASGERGAAVREARLLVAAAAEELDALVAAARGEAPQGGLGGQPSFWSAAGALQRALADLDSTLVAGDPAFFSVLDEAQRSLVALQVAFRRAGTSREARGAAAGASSSTASEETTRRMAALAATVGRLGCAYGRGTVAAVPRGGGLSAAQARQLQGMARAARSWRAALPALAAAARQQGDTALQSELAKLDALLQQLASEQSLTLATYLAAVSASNQALALWSANAAYLDPGEQQASQQADTAASDLTTAADTGFVFSADLSGGTAWTYAEGPPAGDAGAAAGDAGAAGGGAAGDWGGGPGGGPGDAGGPSGDAGGGEWTGLPGEPSAGAGAAAGPGWVVIHGGPDASWQPESLPPAGVSPKLALQLGDAQDEALSPGESATDSGDDGGSEALAPLDWEELCRPWQPAAGSRSVCPLPPLPPLPAVGAGDR